MAEKLPEGAGAQEPAGAPPRKRGGKGKEAHGRSHSAGHNPLFQSESRGTRGKGRK